MSSNTPKADRSVSQAGVSPLAGKPPDPLSLVNIPRLIAAYYTERPDPSIAAHRVSFGTSGHRGSAFACGFNEWHVLAIAQAICRYREAQAINGPLFLGIDTHALSEPASRSALEVLAANGVHVQLAANDEYTPTPAVSHAILNYNRGRRDGPCRRDRDHAFAQPSGGRRIQIQPAARWTGGNRYDARRSKR